MDRISDRRKEIYQAYRRALKPLEAEGLLRLPVIPEDCDSNYHLFYVILPTGLKRDEALEQMRNDGVRSVFHYVPLHNSPKGKELVGEQVLPVTEELSARLLRMPMYFNLSAEEQERAVTSLVNHLKSDAGARANVLTR
jgi:dTDP-4-amino-4,6-dideoxygalactose transaminase